MIWLWRKICEIFLWYVRLIPFLKGIFMTTKDEGCCGHPSRCAFTSTNYRRGRCMIREQYEQAVAPDRAIGIDPVATMSATEDADVQERRNRRLARKLRRLERETQERAAKRGRGRGRTLSAGG